MAELTDIKAKVSYNYKFNLNLTQEQFEHITALERKFNRKGLKTWLVSELEERHAQAFPSPTLEE